MSIILSETFISPYPDVCLWACAYLRPKGTEGRWTAAEYICDLEHIEEL